MLTSAPILDAFEQEQPPIPANLLKIMEPVRIEKMNEFEYTHGHEL